MKIYILICFSPIFALPNSEFFRKHFQFDKFDDQHYYFQGGRPHDKKFENLILAQFDAGLVDDQVRGYLREVVNHLALGPAGHGHAVRLTKLKKFSDVTVKNKNHKRKFLMNDRQKRARKFFIKHHQRN